MRSEIFAAGLFLLHWRSTLWPIVVLQTVLTGWVLWLVVRSVCRRPLATYLVLTLLVLWLACTVLVVVPMNALLCGVVSMSASRLQDRVDWMLALLAGVTVSVVWTARAEPKAESATSAPEAT